MSALYKLGGNVFFLIAYSLFFLPNVYLGIRYRTWGFSFGVLSGLFLEIHGYVARVVMSQRNDDAGADGQDTYYVMQVT